MISMRRGQGLHDRATRNQPLTDEERTELNAWYAQLDAQEARTLRIPTASKLGEIEAQIDSTLRAIQETTSQILETRAETRLLRNRIAELESAFVQDRAPVT